MPDATSPLLTIIHEDADLLVVNKPADLVCHPGKDGPLSSLVGRLRLHLGPEARPHLLNRLDRETSGLVLVGKTDLAARELRRLWAAHRVTKEYLAIVHGHVAPEAGTIDAPLGRDDASRVAIRDRVRTDGVAATTHYAVLRRFARDGAPFSLLRVRPRTGRKHQIRIHLAEAGCPIVGETVYVRDFPDTLLPAPRLMLHAWLLALRHPVSGKLLRLEDPMPADMAGWWEDHRREVVSMPSGTR